MTVRLKGDAGTAMALETWQVGWRFAMSETDPIPLDTGRAQLDTYSVADAIVARTVTNYSVAQGFAGDTGLGGSTITDGDQDALVAAAHAWLVALKSWSWVGYDLDTIRLYPVGPDGKSRTAPSVYTPTGTTQNPTGTNGMPQDVAVAVSTQTATRGVKGRGRVFVGGQIVSNVGTLGQVNSSYVSQLLTSTKTMLDAARAIGGIGGQLSYSPIVWHRTGDKLGIEDGTYGSAVRGIRVDDRFDTQRRRDRRVSRTWTPAALAP